MFSRKDIDHGFIEQPLWFGHAHTQANYDIIRDLKSRVKDKRETIKGRDAYPQIRLLMYTNTRTTQSNFLSLRCFFV